MNRTRFLKSLSFFLCIVLIAAMALFATGCNGNKKTDVVTTTQASEIEAPAPSAVGNGKVSFDFSVTDADGKKTEFTVSTDKSTVGEALLELGIIQGEEGPYGLYVKTVNGITLDYDTDGMYWAFYTNGAYAASGVDSTAITAGTVYEFRAEK